MMRFIPTHHLFCYLILDEPANIAEVLTVRQFCVLREHTVSYLEAACVLQLMCCLERIEVALFLHYFKRRYGVNVQLAVLSCISSNQFQTDSIVQTLLVDNVGNGVLLTAFERAFHQFFRLFAGYDFDAVGLELVTTYTAQDGKQHGKGCSQKKVSSIEAGGV